MDLTKRQALTIWNRLRGQITTMIIHDANSLKKKYLMKCYFYYDFHVDYSTENVTYIGIIINAENITVKKIFSSIKKIRNRFYQALDDGYILMKTKRIDINIQGITPLFSNAIVVNTNERQNQFECYFLEKLLQKIKQYEVIEHI